MRLDIDKNKNSLEITFYDKTPFDKDILVKIEYCFKKLDPSFLILIDLYGNIPIEVIAYIAEVNNHCQLLCIIHDDEKGKAFFKTLLNKENKDL